MIRFSASKESRPKWECETCQFKMDVSFKDFHLAGRNHARRITPSVQATIPSYRRQYANSLLTSDAFCLLGIIGQHHIFPHEQSQHASRWIVLISGVQVVRNGMHARHPGAVAGPLRAVIATGSPESTSTIEDKIVDIMQQLPNIESIARSS